MDRAGIYLDHNATTPLAPEALEAMMPFLREAYGNPSGASHRHGAEARDAVEAARGEIAKLMGAGQAEIVFTSCATESNNLAIKGIAWAMRERGDTIVTTAIEHRSVLGPCRRLESDGFRIRTVAVDGEGRVDPASVAAAIDDRTILVTVMHANSEVGTIQDVAAIGRICREKGVPFHTDATQSLGKIPVDVGEIGCALLTASGHKIYGPKGAGVLYIRRRTRLVPLLDGGGQERDRRSGTLNVPAIVGFGVACRLARERMDGDAQRERALRERLRVGIFARVEGVHLNGPLEGRLPGNLNLSFDGLDGQALIESLKNVSASSGSACAAGSTDPSYVLRAMGMSEERAFGSVRFGIGRGNTEEQIAYALEEIARAVAKLRRLSAAP